MILRSGFLLIAQRLQEAADKISHSTVRDHLRDAVQDAHKGSGKWANYVDHTGDGASGDCIYSCDGDTMSAPYSITATGTKQTAALDTDKGSKVIPVVTYKKQMTEAATDPVAAAAAVIAATKTAEAAAAVASETAGVKLVESAGVEFLTGINVAEAARSTYPIKVISPGTGSSAHYPAAVVEQMAPLVKPGTLMFWNHQTSAEEAERPEGDLDHLAAIVTKQGVWNADGPKGPGVYAEAKVMADYAQKVEERAPHIGLSIRAGGTTTGKTVNGKPELKSIDHIESIDYVTKAGRGGLALVEAATYAGILALPEAARIAANQNTGDSMTPEQLKVLEAAGKLILLGEARRVALETLSDVSLNESAKEEVIRRVSKAIPTKEGMLDDAPFRESVKEEAKAIGAFVASVSGSGNVRYMGGGGPTPVAITEAQREVDRVAGERRIKESENIFGDLLGDPTAAKFAAKGRAA
jgi:hypothetical protein